MPLWKVLRQIKACFQHRCSFWNRSENMSFTFINDFANLRTPLQQSTIYESWEVFFLLYERVCVRPWHLSVASANPDEVKQAQTCKSLKNKGRGRKQQSSLKRHHGSLNLLVGHKHHNVPGPQTKIRRHESAKKKNQEIRQNNQTYVENWPRLRTLYRKTWVPR